jgi:hypothetical protein
MNPSDGPGMGGAFKPIDTIGQGEIECGHLLAHGDGPHPAANFGSHIGVEGNIVVSGNITVNGEIINEKLTALEARVVRLAHDLWMPDGRSPILAIEDLIMRVKKLEDDNKPVLDGGPIMPPNGVGGLSNSRARSPMAYEAISAVVAVPMTEDADTAAL